MTMIPGKDAPLEESIEKMSAQLEALGFDIEQAQWLNPVPNVWSVLIRDRNCPLLFTNGKGASKEAALASALGEYFERLSCNSFFTDYYLGQEVAEGDFVHYPNERWFDVSGEEIPDGLFDEPTLQHYNLHDDLTAPGLIDTNSGNSGRGICAIPFTRQRTGDEVWIPVNIIGNLYISNGAAAGNSVAEARVQALSEIFERHIKNTIITSGISLPEIPEHIINRYPQVVDALNALRDYGYVVLVRDASLGGKYPMVNVTLINPDDGGCCASFGAHPKFEVALERTVTELLRGRALNSLADFPSPSFNLADVADSQNLEAHFIDSSGVVAWDLFSRDTDYEFVEWNVEGDSQAEFEHLCNLIHKVDMDIYIADYEHLNVYTCRIIVPGMSEIYPVDDLVSNNNNAGVEYREGLLDLANFDKDQGADLLVDLNTEGFDDKQLVAELIGIVADKGTAWSTLRVGELKCLLHLQQGNLADALDWCHWQLENARLQESREALYRCLYQCLQFTLDAERDFADYSGLLEQVYGQALMERVSEMLAGERIFRDFPASTLSLEGFTTHQKMLEVYDRLQSAKRAAG